LAETLYQQIGLSRNESSHLVDMVLDRIADALVAGQNVKVSSFGSFIIREKGERIGRNPKTGQEVPITPRRVLVFRPSQSLKKQVSGVKPAPAAA
jgi:integration host factor subunit alpha